MFEDNFSTSDIVRAAQMKHMTMFLGNFIVGVMVDYLGQRALVNAFTNISAILLWIPFFLNASWIRWPMVGLFSISDAAWIGSLYALPVSMVPKEHIDKAMLIVNGIQWFSCAGNCLHI